MAINAGRRQAMSKQHNTNMRKELSEIELITNSIKSAMLGKTKDRIVNINETFGYKNKLDYADFLQAYKRQGLARRIIDATVDFTWKGYPLIVDEERPIDAAVKSGSTLRDLKGIKAKQRRNELLRKKRQLAQAYTAQSYADILKINDEIISVDDTGISYTDFENATFELLSKFPLLQISKRLDTLSCIGRYAVLVIGTSAEVGEGDDDRLNDLSEPLPKGASIDDIAFLQPYSEEQADIAIWETDSSSPRFGMPKMYRITVSGGSGASRSYNVHYSRVIHIAEDLLEDDVYGSPKLEAVYNNLQDLFKVVGGSAEMFWLGAYQGLVFNIKDGYQLDDAGKAAMTEEIENYENKLQRAIKTKGVEVTTLSSPVADPRGNFEVLIKLIAGASNIPERILLGAENGVYAGATDQDTFLTYISSRRNAFAEGSIVRQLLDRLIEHGYLPMPVGGEYFLTWPALFEQTQTERLNNAKIMIDTLKAAAPYGNTLELIVAEEVRTAVGLNAQIPETEYDPLADLGDALIPDEMEELDSEL